MEVKLKGTESIRVNTNTYNSREELFVDVVTPQWQPYLGVLVHEMFHIQIRKKERELKVFVFSKSDQDKLIKEEYWRDAEIIWQSDNIDKFGTKKQAIPEVNCCSMCKYTEESQASEVCTYCIANNQSGEYYV